MNSISLSDIFAFSNLPPNFKISLNKYPGDDHKSNFTDRLSIDDLEYAHWNSAGKKRFRKGDINLVFVKLRTGRYLFVAATEVLEESENGPCKYRKYSESVFDGYFLKLEAEDVKPNRFGSWVFNAAKVVSERKLSNVTISDSKWSRLVFPGYDRVKLTFSELFDIVESDRYESYRECLNAKYGIYLLTDVKTGKKYVGSAYGKGGIAQRWKCYLDTQTGGNKLLKELYEKEGPDYFKKNFEFRLLKDLPKTMSPEDVVDWENWYKDMFGTRIDGYNAN